MFREMRRKNQILSQAECLAVLDRGTSGVLAVQGDGGWPYAVPLSYVYEDGRLWFHCARTGHKLDAIRREPRVSFCVVDQDQVVPQEYTTYFRSVILFGRARVLEDPAEVRAALEKLARRYWPGDTPEHLAAVAEKELPAVTMVEVAVEHLSGKEAKELVRSRHALE